jgi:diacylglycerol kinase (ATP)
MKAYMMVNPAAGGGRARRTAVVAGRRLTARGVDLTIVQSDSAAHLIRLAAQAPRSGADLALVVGGDGAWHYALNGLAKSRLPAALIPCGRGNDFSRNIGLPQRVESAVDVALAGKARDLDLVDAGGRFYIGVAGVGFDSEVTARANDRFPFLPGPLAYTAAIFNKLFAFRPKWVRIQHDGGLFEGRIMFAVFANSKSYGGGMRIAPAAEMDDGLMDVVVVQEVGLGMLLRTLPKVFSGSHLPHPRIKTFRTAKAEVTSPDPLELYGDGERIGPAPATLTIAPKAARVIVP